MQTKSHQTGSAHCDGAPVRYARHRPEQITLYHQMLQYVVRFIAHTEAGISGKLTARNLPFVGVGFRDNPVRHSACRSLQLDDHFVVTSCGGRISALGRFETADLLQRPTPMCL